MRWYRPLLCAFATGCLMVSATGCTHTTNPYARHSDGQNPYARRGTKHYDAYPEGYYPGYNPRGPGRHSLGKKTSHGRPKR